MNQALREATKALDAGEVPIGAVVVLNNSIIGRGYNQVETLNDATAHAEMIAITAAFNHLGSKYLPDATVYVTLEPCSMCAGAMYWSKISKLVYGASDPKHGGISRLQASSADGDGRQTANILHPKTTVVAGVEHDKCLQVLKEFFKSKR